MAMTVRGFGICVIGFFIRTPRISEKYYLQEKKKKKSMQKNE
jgi:hypothetical protein